MREVEIVGGRLILRGAWSEWDRRDVCVSIHPEDVSIVEDALERFRTGELEFSAERQTRKEKVEQERQERARKRAEARKRPEPPKGTIKLIDVE